ncbi:MAG: hypothetical protein SOV24_04860 [Muribaculaceae bacterium]|nr:hypothetical protein [Bacteroidales bacterium]MDY2733678.1 hypothetical protein [Muribaculaceae bacterium]
MKSFEDQYQKNNNDGMAYNDSDHSHIEFRSQRICRSSGHK